MFGNNQYQPKYIPWLYKSIRSYTNKPGKVEMMDMTFEPVEIRGIGELMKLLAAGYTVQKGVLDYIDGIKYTTRSGSIESFNSRCIPVQLALSGSHCIGSYFIFFDIDDCNINADQFINNLTYKPSGAYYTFSGSSAGTIKNGEINYRFRLIYAFYEPLNMDEWRGACEYLEASIENDNPGIDIDSCSNNIGQAMHGTDGKNKIIPCQEVWYNFSQLGCKPIHKEQKEAINIPLWITSTWDRGVEFINTLKENVINFKVLRMRFGKELRVVTRVENSNWIIVKGNNGNNYAYQFINKSEYLRLPVPKGYNPVTKEGKVGKGKRQRWLTSQAKKIRIIAPDITPQDMIFTLFFLRDKFIKYREGNDYIGYSSIILATEKAFSYDIDDLRYLNRGWIKQERERNKDRKIIVSKVKQLSDGKLETVTSTERRQLTKFILDEIYNQEISKKLNEFYDKNPLTTPISKVADDLNIDWKTTKKHIIKNNIPAQPERKAYEKHKESRKPRPLKYNRKDWYEKYDPLESKRENMRRLGLTPNSFYRHEQRYGLPKND